MLRLYSKWVCVTYANALESLSRMTRMTCTLSIMKESVQSETGPTVTFSENVMSLSEVLSHQLYKIQINVSRQYNSPNSCMLTGAVLSWKLIFTVFRLIFALLKD